MADSNIRQIQQRLNLPVDSIRQPTADHWAARTNPRAQTMMFNEQ